MRMVLRLVVILLCSIPITLSAMESLLSIQPYDFKLANRKVVPAELGEFKVPENRSRPDSRTITLRFVRFRCTSQKPGSPIIYLAGGPGGSGIDAARGSRFRLFEAMREFGDVIALDQRGTGMSEPDLSCQEQVPLPLTEPLNPESAGKIAAAAAASCFARLRDAGHDLQAYNTMENAADLDDLRKALGSEKITLWGISYGTHLSLAAMKYYGPHIERVILAGVEPLHHTLKLPSDQDELLKRLSEMAKRRPEIHHAFPDMAASLSKLIQDLAKNPRSIHLVHPLNGMEADVVVGAYDLQIVVAGMLSGPEAFSILPDFIARLENGDWTALALQSAGLRIGQRFNAMSLAMDCASGASREWKERIRKEGESTILSDAINFPFPQVCDGAGVKELPESFRESFSSSIPALMISGTLDGRTPPRNAESISKDLTNSQHLVIENAGHSDDLFLSSPEILKAMTEFMRGKKLHNTHVQARTVKFTPIHKVVDLPTEVLERYTGDYRINDREIRRVIRAGSILYTQRGDGSPFPIRPMSETDFFYEGHGWLKFEMDSNGTVTGMIVHQTLDDQGETASRMNGSSAGSVELGKQVDRYLEPYLKAGLFSGSILIAKGDDVLLKKGYGKASVEFDIPNTPSTKFHIASISKGFTSAAIMMLRDEGKLSVTDPVSRYVPGFLNGDNIQIQHLLTHTSGIPNVNGFSNYDEKSRFPQTLESIIQWVQDKPQLFPPGEKYSYSNTNYNLLAYIIEQVSKQSYGDFLHEHIFQPLKMLNTDHDGDSSRIVKNSASGYVPVWIGELEKAPYLDWSIKTGNGSIYSTVEDLYRFDRALYGDALLSHNTIQEIYANKYGWFVGERFGKKRVQLNGRSPGFCSYLERYIDDDVFIVVLANQYTTVAHAIIGDIAAIVFSEKYELPKPFVEASGANLERFEGTYTFGEDFYNPGSYQVQVMDGRLYLTRETYRWPLIPVSGSEFFLVAFWAHLGFVEDASGNVTGLIYDDGTEFRAKHVSGI